MTAGNTQPYLRSIEDVYQWFASQNEDMKYWTLYRTFTTDGKNQKYVMFRFTDENKSRQESWDLLEEMLNAYGPSGGRMTVFVRNVPVGHNGPSTFIRMGSVPQVAGING